MTQRATVLFAHGSRDPLWSRPMEAIVQRTREIDATRRVVCAFLELTDPDLPTAVQELVAGGATEITIIPMFLGVGRHARHDLPILMATLAQSHPQIKLHLQPSIGEDPRVLDLMARIALD